MDNSVDYGNYFSELSIREFWTKCVLITRILYLAEEQKAVQNILSSAIDHIFINDKVYYSLILYFTMGEYYFVYETSNAKKIRVFLISFFILILLASFALIFQIKFYSSFKDSFIAKGMENLIQGQITQLTPVGLFFAGFLGGSFIIPSPLEILFYISLTKGNSILLSFLLLNFGLLLIQIVNYWFGAKCSSFVMNFLSVKKVYKVRRLTNKYGAFLLFFLSVIPALPYEVLTFALGIARYNFYRLFILVTLGSLIKYAVIAGVFVLLH